jgi:hypothetical protein
MKRRAWLCGLACVWLWVAADPAIAGGPAKAGINCDIQTGPCRQTVAGCKVTLDILPRPVKAMQDLTFRVTVDGPVPGSRAPYIDLNMPAMDMGPNRVALVSKGRGVYEGRGVIVRCRSNIRTWQAGITFPDAGRANFIFDVDY